MLGNLVIVFVFWILVRKNKKHLNVLVGGIVGSVAKAAVMALTISYGVLSTVTLPEAMQAKLPVLRTTYSVTQLITAVIGVAYTLVIWAALKKAFETDN